MDNVVFMIGEKSSRRFFNAQKGGFYEQITFNSFYPARMDCEAVLRSIVSGSSRHKYAIVEAEVLRFDGRELVVSFDENFRENPPF